MRKSGWKLTALMLLVFMMMTTVGAASSNEEYTPVVKTANQEAVFINSIEVKNGKVYLNVDPIQWYEGEEANEIFREREQDPEMTEAPDGYYIINDKEEQVILDVADDAVVQLQLYDHTGRAEDAQIQWNQAVSLKKFIAVYNKKDIIDMKWFPYHVTVEDGTVVKIVQQYTP
ncbi:hypothetical protein [Paenibacillus dakarensis]|uniref:hypothetical protein n=1 Tax=Paenibacillus dakarensis TaxID=1527293 RepID=UPI0006D58DB4|nr:hypothetical protein [Paenibacillus dakarensis]